MPAYASNNPILFVDPDGQDSCKSPFDLTYDDPVSQKRLGPQALIDTKGREFALKYYAGRIAEIDLFAKGGDHNFDEGGKGRQFVADLESQTSLEFGSNAVTLGLFYKRDFKMNDRRLWVLSDNQSTIMPVDQCNPPLPYNPREMIQQELQIMTGLSFGAIAKGIAISAGMGPERSNAVGEFVNNVFETAHRMEPHAGPLVEVPSK